MTQSYVCVYVGKMGIDENDHVVVYDTAGVFSACRVYWTFKVTCFSFFILSLSYSFTRIILYIYRRLAMTLFQS